MGMTTSSPGGAGGGAGAERTAGIWDASVDAQEAQAPSSSVTRRNALRYVKFGNSDMVVSELCAGTMTWGSFNADESMAHEQMDALVKAGVNYFDTAELYPVAWDYGKTTEKWMGNYFAKQIAEGNIKRSDFYIATKCNPAGIGGSGNAHALTLDELEFSLNASLERLQTDYIDLYQLHWPTRNVPVFGCASYFVDRERLPKVTSGGDMDVFEKQVIAVKALLDSGKIKYWGLSNENAYGLTMFCIACDKLGVPRPISVQNDFSLCNRTYETDLLEACHRFGVVGLPYGCLAGGVLTGKYIPGTEEEKRSNTDRPIEECRMRKSPGFQPRYGMPEVMRATEKYAKLAREYGITPCEMAYAWANQRWFNGAIITGTTTIAQVEEAVRAFKLDLPTELLDKIEIIHEEIRNPCCHMSSKPACVEAPWLGDKAMNATKAKY